MDKRCDGNNHELIDICSFKDISLEGAYDVVRWCTCCGAVVVDKDIDNRIFAGRICKMKFPRLAYPKK